MPSLIISIGSNVSPQYVKDSLEWLTKQMGNFMTSGIYPTPSVSMDLTPSLYHNAVASGTIAQSVGEFNLLLKDYECRNGRTPELKSRGIVPIDLDIVVADGCVLRPWDFNQEFFKTGFSELPCPVI